MVTKNFRSLNEAIHNVTKYEPASFYVKMKVNIKNYVDKEFESFINAKNKSKNKKQLIFNLNDFEEFRKKLNGDMVAKFD